MLKKELTAALFMVGAVAPFAVHADYSAPSGYSESDEPTYVAGESFKEGDLPAGYNQNANYKLDDSYDVYVTADFIYWNLQQDSMRVGNLMDPSSVGALGLLSGTDETVFNSGKYKPGFQVGLGFNMNGMDGWNLYSEYTWYQNTHSTTLGTSGSEVVSFSYAEDGAPRGIGDDIVVADSVTLKSKYHYNNLNVMLQRPFYFGRKLIANFGAGLRGLWFSQTVTSNASGVTAYDSGSTGAGTSLANASLSFYQKSWELGPRFEFNTKWMLSRGFKIMANIAQSVLYARYTALDGSLGGGITDGITAALSTSVKGNYNTLRAITEASMGFGWGRYLGSKNDFHIDFSAMYDFNMYWNQNMYGMVVNGYGSPGNTYLQGLNVGARFDF